MSKIPPDFLYYYQFCGDFHAGRFQEDFQQRSISKNMQIGVKIWESQDILWKMTKTLP